ncbi:MAG: hypothetical protein C0625_01455 [Arcobacter sp.]|nr:MAG: hypothetical protein C0625_01455 [Arcobacter sp.]
MYKLPNEAKKISLEGSTVDFFEYIKNNIKYYYFDTSLTSPPDPMVNAMIGLQLLDNENKRLIMINHSIPNALFTRVSTNFEYEIEETSGTIKIEFKYKTSSILETDFSNNKCGS